MVELLNVITLIWLTLCVGFATIKLVNGYNDTIWIVTIVFYVFYSVPLLSDILFGKPTYDMFPGYAISSQDNQTQIIYCIFVSIIPIIWFLTGRVKNLPRVDSNEDEIPKKLNVFLKVVFTIGLIGPIIALFFSPNPSIYLNYAAATRQLITLPEENQFHDLLSNLTLFSVISAAGLLYLRKTTSIVYLMMLSPIIFTSIWISGKRTIVLLTLMLLTFVFWNKGKVNGWKLPIVALLFIIIVGGFSVFYQSQVRGDLLSTLSSEQQYDAMRVDFGRDDRVKLAIYLELHPESMKILEYRGQSILFNLAIYVPRNIWPDKPWPYAVYSTAAAVMIPIQYIGWGVTTSILEEMIANLGWLGLLVGPLLISWFCRTGDKYNSFIVKLLTILIACLLLVLQVATYFPLLMAWIVLVFLQRRKKKQESRPNRGLGWYEDSIRT